FDGSELSRFQIAQVDLDAARGELETLADQPLRIVVGLGERRRDERQSGEQLAQGHLFFPLLPACPQRFAYLAEGRQRVGLRELRLERRDAVLPFGPAARPARVPVEQRPGVRDDRAAAATRPDALDLVLVGLA